MHHFLIRKTELLSCLLWVDFACGHFLQKLFFLYLFLHSMECHCLATTSTCKTFFILERSRKSSSRLLLYSSPEPLSSEILQTTLALPHWLFFLRKRYVRGLCILHLQSIEIRGHWVERLSVILNRDFFRLVLRRAHAINTITEAIIAVIAPCADLQHIIHVVGIAHQRGECVDDVLATIEDHQFAVP